MFFPALAVLGFSLSACGGEGDGESAGTVIIAAPSAPSTPSASLAPKPAPSPTASPAASVSSTAELTRALEDARGGETISLAPGRYELSLLGKQLSNPVTITSADASSRAELNGLAFRDVAGIKLTNLNLIDRTPETTDDFVIRDSVNIVFEKVAITTVKGSGSFQNGMLMVRASTGITITKSEISHARYGISLLNSRDISVTKNYFHDLRTDGVRGGGNSDIEILDNLFTDFAPVNGDHPDAIQFWTTNTTASASDIRIMDNVIVRGKGAAMQGIFMGNEASVPYRNVSIQRNTVIGTMYHGIMVGSSSTVDLRDNRVAGMSDMKSWIKVPAASVLKGNFAQLFILDGVNMPSLTGNTVIPVSADSGAGYAQTWLTANPR